MTAIGFAGFVTLAATAGALAQQPATPPAPAHNTFVLAGCLEAPARGAAPFRLTDAQPVGQAPPFGPTPAAKSGAPATTKPGFLLQPTSGLHQSGVDADVLKTHVGQRVEVTVRPPETVAAAPAPATGASAASPSGPAPDAPQLLSVTSIKSVPGTCG